MLAHLRLCQVLIWPHKIGGEERFRRPKVGKEAIDTEEKGRVDDMHVGLAQNDLHTPGTDGILLLLWLLLRCKPLGTQTPPAGQNA